MSAWTATRWPPSSAVLLHEPGLELPAASPDNALRQSLILAYGMWLGVPGVAEKTGLPAAQPPDDVHAMARGPLAAAGGIYDADMVVDALSGVGVDIDGEVSVGPGLRKLFREVAASPGRRVPRDPVAWL